MFVGRAWKHCEYHHAETLVFFQSAITSSIVHTADWGHVTCFPSQCWWCPQPRPTIFGPREELVPQFISGQNFPSRTHDYAILYPWNQRLVLIAVHL